MRLELPMKNVSLNVSLVRGVTPQTAKAHCCVMGGAAKELPSYSNVGIHSTASDLEVGVRIRKSRKEHCVSF